jgi:hypothetical protein
MINHLYTLNHPFYLIRKSSSYPLNEAKACNGIGWVPKFTAIAIAIKAFIKLCFQVIQNGNLLKFHLEFFTSKCNSVIYSNIYSTIYSISSFTATVTPSGSSFVINNLLLSSTLFANSTNDSSIASLYHKYLNDRHPLM